MFDFTLMLSKLKDTIIARKGDIMCMSLLGLLVAGMIVPFVDSFGLYIWLIEFFLVPISFLVFITTLIIYILDNNRIEREFVEFEIRERERKRNKQRLN